MALISPRGDGICRKENQHIASILYGLSGKYIACFISEIKFHVMFVYLSFTSVSPQQLKQIARAGAKDECRHPYFLFATMEGKRLISNQRNP